MNTTEEITLLTDNIHLLTKDQAWHYRVLPKSKAANRFILYCEDAADQYALSAELEILLGTDVSLEPIPAEQIARLLSKYYIKDNAAQGSAQVQVNNNADDFLANLIQEAKNLKSSDIHIESYENKCRVRIRIDGMMVERYLLKREDYPALINKVKIIANLDIAEKRLPQDGRINFKHNGQQFDIRASVLPTLHGEKVVLRLLNNDATDIDLNSLGFSKFDLDNYLQGAKKPNGILLISGPTGSGKTTTLYATLKLLKTNRLFLCSV